MKVYISGAITNNPNYLSEFAAAEEKLLAKRGNREYNIENKATQEVTYDRAIAKNSSNGAKTCPVHRW